MAHPPSGDMSILATLLASMLEKQGQMLQAISDTNRNVDRLASRMDGIEAFLRGARRAAPAVQSAAPPAAVASACVPVGAALGTPEQMGVSVAGPSRPSGFASAQNASAGSHKEVVAPPPSTILTAAPSVENLEPFPASVSSKNTHTLMHEATSEPTEVVVACPSKVGSC